MGYVAVKGGEKAIESALKLTELFRKDNRLAADQVMGEGGLYAPDLAEMAIKQAEGDLIEASFLIRAYRSTLPRIGFSEPIDTREMFLVRRISSAFREISGGQILGPTRDYTQRLLDFDAPTELDCSHEAFGLDEVETKVTDGMAIEKKDKASPKAEKVSDLLRKEGLLDAPAEGNADPFDITRDDLLFPLPRSGRLQALARGESGAMLALAYSSLRGYGSVHPTLAELRAGFVQLKIRHPHTGEDVSIGEIFLTECEGILHSCIGGVEFEGSNSESDVEGSEGDSKFSLGYGLVFGQNERKAISMAVLDGTTSVKEPKAPAEDQEFVFYHIDGVDAQGFIEHLKLPHYVTFQSSLDRAKRARGESD